MHMHAAGFDLVTVRSGGVDRRALSQAWYDTLHLARSSVRSSGLRCTSVHLGDAQLFHPGKVCSPTFRSRHPWLREKLERATVNARGIAPPQTKEESFRERRARFTGLACDIVAELRKNPVATRFTFATPQGRVCLYLVRGPKSTQIIAFCPPAVRDVVQKALVQVRYAIGALAS
jgi:hypothetical protein